MKRQIVYFLTISLFVATITPSVNALTSAQTFKDLTHYKKAFENNVSGFIKCVKGDQDCDPKKKKAFRAALAIIGILTLAIISGGIIYAVKKRKIEPLPEEVKKPEETKQGLSEEQIALNKQLIKEVGGIRT